MSNSKAFEDFTVILISIFEIKIFIFDSLNIFLITKTCLNVNRYVKNAVSFSTKEQKDCTKEQKECTKEQKDTTKEQKECTKEQKDTTKTQKENTLFQKGCAKT